MHKKDDPNNPVLTWNTGRGYSEEGQKIAAVLHDGHIYYMDFTRHLEGCVEARRFEYSGDDIKKIVMFCYDNNIGSGHIDLWAVKDRLKEYKDLVDDIKRQNAFNGG